MKQSAVEAVIRGLKKAGVSVVCYLPDSLFKELYPALDADPELRTIRVTNEGEGAAICGGVFLSGKKAALVMENSGLRASVEPLARMGLRGRNSGRDADELSRRTRRKQLVGHSARHHHGAGAGRASHSLPGGARGLVNPEWNVSFIEKSGMPLESPVVKYEKSNITISGNGSVNGKLIQKDNMILLQ